MTNIEDKIPHNNNELTKESQKPFLRRKRYDKINKQLIPPITGTIVVA